MTGRGDNPRIGWLPAGPRDSICDVAGVTVGHATLAQGPLQTGVTVVRPHGGDLFRDKVPAAAAILNGFGKSVGLVQVAELGVLETPIALTNTFSVAAVAQAQIRAALQANPEIGRAWPTVNPLVFECNDGYLNDIQAMAVDGTHYAQALAAAGTECLEGAVGAGRGMSCFAFKGGIGTASRLARDAAGPGYTVGALVLANFGRRPALTVAGRPFGQWLENADASAAALERRDGAAVALRAQPQQTQTQTQTETQTGTETQAQTRTETRAPAAPAGAGRPDDGMPRWPMHEPPEGPTAVFAPVQRGADDIEKGSIILLLATDAPLDARQLQRLALRAGAGLARTGSVFGHGSGDIALAFSTNYTVPHLPERPMPAVAMLHDARMDPLFEAAAEATEQAIVHALWQAETVTGRDGHVRQSIRTAVPQWRQWLQTGPR